MTPISVDYCFLFCNVGSRAYVLLSLTRSDNDSPADAENRTTLMELFAETTSKEEHGFSFDNISLPQVSVHSVAAE